MDINDLRKILQNTLDATCASRTNPHGGAYAANDVPPTTLAFSRTVDDEADSFKANAWSLDLLDKLTLVEQTKTIYKTVYGGWVNNPLPGDAPPEVVAWQKTARETGV